MAKWILSPTQLDTMMKDIAAGMLIKDILVKYHIDQASFSDLLRKDALFKKNFEEARKIAALAKAEQLETIADECASMLDIHIARLKSDNIKFLVSKHNRETYGDKQEVNINNTLDLSKILEAAKNRVAPMLRDVTPSNHTLIENQATGCKPVDAQEADNDCTSIDDLI